MAVFVMHPIRQDDVSAATKWGPFRFINKRYVYGDELETHAETGVGAHYQMPAAVEMKLNQAALEFQGDRDYILIAGDHLQLAYFTGLIARRWAEFGVLRFDKKISDYIPVRLHMGIARRVPPMLLSSNIGERPDAQDSSESQAARARREDPQFHKDR